MLHGVASTKETPMQQEHHETTRHAHHFRQVVASPAPVRAEAAGVRVACCTPSFGVSNWEPLGMVSHLGLSQNRGTLQNRWFPRGFCFLGELSSVWQRMYENRTSATQLHSHMNGSLCSNSQQSNPRPPPDAPSGTKKYKPWVGS